MTHHKSNEIKNIKSLNDNSQIQIVGKPNGHNWRIR